MSGQTNLQEVLSSMEISCDEIKYGFACLAQEIDINLKKITGIFQEKEGLTAIAPIEYLEEIGVKSYEGPYAKLTVEVHTSLELVGLTAELATKLAEQGVSANVVAGFYHDHVFVQFDMKEKAVKALMELN